MRDILVKRPWGEFTFSHDPTFLDENFEHEIFEFTKGQIRESDIIFDIGAHQGLYTTYFATCAPKGMVYAFEPHPTNYKYLLNNTQRFSNVRSINKAVGSDDEKRVLMAWDTSIEGTTGRHSFSEMGGTIPIEVDVVSIDTFVRENNIHVDFIKMDVELWEYAVLHGAKKTIESQMPKMVIEIHGSDWQNKHINPNLARIENFMDSIGMSHKLIKGSAAATSETTTTNYTCPACGRALNLTTVYTTHHYGTYMAVNCE